MIQSSCRKTKPFATAAFQKESLEAKDQSG